MENVILTVHLLFETRGGMCTEDYAIPIFHELHAVYTVGYYIKMNVI